MGIDELIQSIEEVGVGADTKIINQHIGECQAAVNLGLSVGNELRETVSKSNGILRELGGRMFDTDLKLNGDSNTAWLVYAEEGTANAEKFLALAKEIYKESNEIEVVAEKQHFGPKVVLEYMNGVIRSGHIKFYGRRGKLIIDDKSNVSGVCKSIATAKPLKVYGVLTMDYTECNQNDILSSIVVREMGKENCGRLRFIAECSNSKAETVMDELNELEELGFEVEEHKLISTDIYDFDEKIGNDIEKEFEYSDEEILDNIIIRYNDKGAEKIAKLNSDDSFINNIIAVQMINNANNKSYKAVVKRIELRQIYDEIKIIAHINIVDSDEEDELELKLDDIYNIEALETINVTEKGGKLTLSE